MFDIKDVKDPMHPSAVCCLLVINCFPFFKFKKKDCYNSGHCQFGHQPDRIMLS